MNDWCMKSIYHPTVKFNKELAQKYVDDIRYRIKMLRSAQSIIEQKMLCDEIVYFFIPRLLSEHEIYLTDIDLVYQWNTFWSKDIRSILDKVNNMYNITKDFYLFSERTNNSEVKDHIANSLNDMNKTIEPLIAKAKENLILEIDDMAKKLETDIENYDES